MYIAAKQLEIQNSGTHTHTTHAPITLFLITRLKYSKKWFHNRCTTERDVRVERAPLTKPMDELVKQVAVFLQGYVPHLNIRGAPLPAAFYRRGRGGV